MIPDKARRPMTTEERRAYIVEQWRDASGLDFDDAVALLVATGLTEAEADKLLRKALA